MVTLRRETSVDKARAEVDRLWDQENAWSQRKRAVTEQISALEATAGAALIDAVEPTGALREQASALASLRAEAAACDHAITEARRRRAQAVPAVWLAQAAEKRNDAAKLRKGAAERTKRTDGLLSELQAFEGVDYAVSQPATPPFDPGVVGGAPVIVRRYMPKTQLIIDEADRLEAEAAELEGRQVSRSGFADGSSVAELVQACTADPMRIAPLVADIETWAEDKAKAQGERRRQHVEHKARERGVNPQTIEAAGGYVPPDAPISFSLHWVNSVIDTAQSTGRPA